MKIFSAVEMLYSVFLAYWRFSKREMSSSLHKAKERELDDAMSGWLLFVSPIHSFNGLEAS